MKFTSIRVGEDTKLRLEKYKRKNGTHDNILSSFLDYFETSGIKPTDVNLSKYIF